MRIRKQIYLYKLNKEQVAASKLISGFYKYVDVSDDFNCLIAESSYAVIMNPNMLTDKEKDKIQENIGDDITLYVFTEQPEWICKMQFCVVDFENALSFTLVKRALGFGIRARHEIAEHDISEYDEAVLLYFNDSERETDDQFPAIHVYGVYVENGKVLDKIDLDIGCYVFDLITLQKWHQEAAWFVYSQKEEINLIQTWSRFLDVTFQKKIVNLEEIFFYHFPGLICTNIEKLIIKMNERKIMRPIEMMVELFLRLYFYGEMENDYAS